MLFFPIFKLLLRHGDDLISFVNHILNQCWLNDHFRENMEDLHFSPKRLKDRMLKSFFKKGTK